MALGFFSPVLTDYPAGDQACEVFSLTFFENKRMTSPAEGLEPAQSVSPLTDDQSLSAKKPVKPPAEDSPATTPSLLTLRKLVFVSGQFFAPVQATEDQKSREILGRTLLLERC